MRFVVPYDGRPFRFVTRLRRLVRSQKVALVLSHGLGMHLLIGLGSRMGGARHVFALVGNPPPSDRALVRKVRIRAHLARPFVQGEIACSQYVKSLMVRDYFLPERRIAVVPNGCNTEVIASRARAANSSRRARPWIGGNRSPVLIMVARLDPIKDHATVLRAIPTLRIRYPGVLLRLVGDGVLMGPLKKLAHDLRVDDAVEFMGARDDVPELLASADAFVFSTTRDEGFGIVLIEAMAAGLPILCSDVGPCAEVLDGGKAGILFEAGSPESVVNAVESLLQAPEIEVELVKRGLALARDRYSHSTAGAQILRLTSGVHPGAASLVSPGTP